MPGIRRLSVGKLHVYPPRDRIGFDDVMLAEEGRPHLGGIDDYRMFLAERGHVGQQFAGGMNNNNYMHRPWHLPEDYHSTNWLTQAMCRVIKRRDPTRPAFWYLSYHASASAADAAILLHGFLPPVRAAAAAVGRVVRRSRRAAVHAEDGPQLLADAAAGCLREARRAFYALCTHIDHQFRVVLGTLREEGLLDDTIILFTADHGDMLGDFGAVCETRPLRGFVAHSVHPDRHGRGYAAAGGNHG